MTYTRSYWKELCEELLGLELHHIPTLGGTEEQLRFKKQYLRMLAFYEEIFQEKPPQAIWPPVDKRFEAADAFTRINRKEKWIIRRPKPIIQKLAAISTLPVLLVSCSDNLAEEDIWFWLKVALGIYIVYRLFRWLGSGGGSGCGGCGG
ncbi:MAG: hypothetical protein KZQ95_01395 [Candidatus Thiodiazotropha sp. (ex Epidulcina cf. delphinae)]|nr:hypothetical protein [Candidatus Thiodiazotropha sp. (ex Epidulcina cf. delphinae)]